MKKKTNQVIRIISLFGILAFIFYILHDVLGALSYPGYNPFKQAVSDLTAIDAPSFHISRLLSFIYGIFTILTLLATLKLIENKNKVLKIATKIFIMMSTVSTIGYTLFPLSSKGYDGSLISFVHVYIITILVVLLSIASLILYIVGFIKDKNKLMIFLTIITLLFMMLGAILSSIINANYFGIVERFSTYSVVVYTLIIGVYAYIISKD